MRLCVTDCEMHFLIDMTGNVNIISQHTAEVAGRSFRTVRLTADMTSAITKNVVNALTHPPTSSTSIVCEAPVIDFHFKNVYCSRQGCTLNHKLYQSIWAVMLLALTTY